MELLIKFTGFKPTASLTHVIFFTERFLLWNVLLFLPTFHTSTGMEIFVLKKREKLLREWIKKSKKKSTKVWNRLIARTSFLKICIFEVSPYMAHSLRAGDMAQWVRELAAKSNGLSLSFRAHMLQGESQFLQGVFCPPCTPCCVLWMHLLHIPMLKNNNKTTYTYLKGRYLLPEEMLFAQCWKIASNTTNWLLAWSILVC